MQKKEITIRVPANSLYPYLNQAKCIRILQPLIPKGETFSLPINIDSFFNQDSYHDDGIFENLAHMICEQDKSGLLQWDYTSEGESFVFCTFDSSQYHASEITPLRKRIVHALLNASRMVCDLSDADFFNIMQEIE